VDRQKTDSRSCMSVNEYRDDGGRLESWKSVVVGACSLSMNSPTRGAVGSEVRSRSVLIAASVDGGGVVLGLMIDCARILWSEGDISECSAACTRACRAWDEHGEWSVSEMFEELHIMGLNRMCAAISISEEGVWDLSGVAEKDNTLSEEESR